VQPSAANSDRNGAQGLGPVRARRRDSVIHRLQQPRADSELRRRQHGGALEMGFRSFDRAERQPRGHCPGKPPVRPAVKHEGQKGDNRNAECGSRKMREAGRETGLEGENQEEYRSGPHGPGTPLMA
jgi:hypothetical protein